MKLSDMNFDQAREINALYQGALFVANKKEEKIVKELFNCKTSSFDEMVLDFKVFFHWKMIVDQNAKSQIENFFRLNSISSGCSTNWRL